MRKVFKSFSSMYLSHVLPITAMITTTNKMTTVFFTLG